MASRSITRRWTAADAERVLEPRRESGQSTSAFARQHDFDVQRLRWWKKRLADWNGDDEGPARFAPALISGSGNGARVSLRLAEGILIEVAEVHEVPPAWLYELVSGLRGRR